MSGDFSLKPCRLFKHCRQNSVFNNMLLLQKLILRLVGVTAKLALGTEVRLFVLLETLIVR